MAVPSRNDVVRQSERQERVVLGLERESAVVTDGFQLGEHVPGGGDVVEWRGGEDLHGAKDGSPDRAQLVKCA